MKLTITTHEEQAKRDRAHWRSLTPEERLDAVEVLRLEAGKFLYEYPSRLRRVVAITRRAPRCLHDRGRLRGVEVTFIGFDDLVKNKQATPRAKDKADVEELTQP